LLLAPVDRLQRSQVRSGVQRSMTAAPAAPESSCTGTSRLPRHPRDLEPYPEAVVVSWHDKLAVHTAGPVLSDCSAQSLVSRL